MEGRVINVASNDAAIHSASYNGSLSHVVIRLRRMPWSQNIMQCGQLYSDDAVYHYDVGIWEPISLSDDLRDSTSTSATNGGPTN